MEYLAWYKLITAHLAEYKEKTLNIHDSGYYGKKKLDFVLPRPFAQLNYMWDVTRVPIKKQLNYHHLTCTQTMCLNFFLPLCADGYKGLSQFVSHYIHREVKITGHVFDYAPGGEGTTNFDFYCKDSAGREYCFEIKYTEKGIEKACKLPKDNSDARLIETYEKNFRERCLADGSYLKFTAEKPLSFMKEHYQVFRSVLAANTVKKNYCFFITMSGNEETEKEITEAMAAIKGRTEYVRLLKWENVIPYTTEYIADPNLQGYYMEFRDKYLLDKE